ncbi:MAG: 50S ribosomal protein L22 [Candidatus Pacebacteria bacterium]|nr:50S ribosomal protein L22 [Candidatus Paceibacterota bacterium]
MASTGTHKAPAAARKAEAKRTIRAELSTYNQSPRKVRLVTDMVKGKKIADAVAALSFLPKRAALPIKKLIESAAANGVAKGEDKDTLRVENIQVNSAGMIVRFMPRAMGRAAPIRKRRSNVIVTLSVEKPASPTA